MIKLPEPAGYFYHDDTCGCEVAPPTPYYTEDQLKQAIRDALDESACLSQQDHVEYFGEDIRAMILKLKEELK